MTPTPTTPTAESPHAPTALVVVESLFGSTRTVARALAAGLKDAGAGARVVAAERAPRTLPEGLGLLVLAAPTHNRGLPTAASRAQAVTRGAPSAPSSGLREWLEAAVVPPGLPVAAADTVASLSWFSGSAAKAVVQRLARTGHRATLERRSFLVGSAQGPLADGQEEAARAWGRALAQALLRASGSA